jgi:hypothetical protein
LWRRRRPEAQEKEELKEELREGEPGAAAVPVDAGFIGFPFLLLSVWK